MKTKQLWIIAAIVVIIWSCNYNQVSRPAANFRLSETSSAKGKLSLLTSTNENQNNPQNTFKKEKKTINKIVENKELHSTEASYHESIVDDEQKLPLTLESLYKEFDAPLQTYQINPNEDNTIVCEEGTEILIPKGSFKLPTNEEENAIVSINVKEYYGKSNLLLGNLSTVSNERLIESGGTIYLEALHEGNELELQKEIGINFPSPEKELKEGMELFTGQKDKRGQINWQSNGNMNYRSSLNGNNNGTLNKSRVRASPKTDFTYFNEYLLKKYKLPITEKFRGIKKTVMFKFDIDPKGNLVSVSTDDDLDERMKAKIIPILEGIKKWRIHSNQNYQNRKKKNTEPVTEYLTLKFLNRSVKVKGTSNYRFSAQKGWWNKLNYDNPNTVQNGVNTQSNFSNDTLTNSAMQYAFKSSKMGWINCDRFLGTNAPLANIEIPGDEFAKTDFKLVLKNINSIMPAYINDQGYLFPNIPKGSTATILAIKVENNKIFATTKEIIVGEDVGKFSFQELTKNQLKELLMNLNS